jgi:hypothetical protein
MTDRDQLDAAATLFHRVAMAMQGRKLIARGIVNDVIRAKIESQLLTDEQIGELCADAFENIVMHTSAR